MNTLKKVEHQSDKKLKQKVEAEFIANDTNAQRTVDDPLQISEAEEKLKSRKDEMNILDSVVDSIIERLEKPVEIIPGVSHALLKTSKGGKQLPGERQQDKEKRLIRNRLLKFKNRLLFKIEKPEKAQLKKAQITQQTRIRREKRLKTETSEETAARKQKSYISSITLRKRMQELETTEQKIERMAKDRELSRLRLHRKRATETPEERLERKQRQKDYQRSRRIQNLAMRTGKFHKRHKQKRKDQTNTDETKITN